MQNPRYGKSILAGCAGLLLAASDGNAAQIAFIQTGAPQQVLSPTMASINAYGGLGTLSDEHQTIFPPGTFAAHPNDYLFFVAAKTTLNGGSTPGTGNTSGLVVLSSGGPNPAGTWTLDFAADYGSYGGTNGQVFLSPMNRESCPDVAVIADQDVTFDLNYANPGSVVIDPTNPGNAGPGNLLMVYEGTNKCVGVINSTTATTTFYAGIGIATSASDGVTWPTYKATATFGFIDLPQQNMSQGPGVPWTAFGTGGPVCIGNDCVTTPPSPLYGRYGVLSPVVSIPTAAQSGPLTTSMGDGEPSAFVDEVGSAKAGGTFLYIVHGYTSGKIGLGAPHTDPKSHAELMIARAPLGANAKLAFTKWFGNSVTYGDTSSGAFDLTTYALDTTLNNDGSGVESPIFPMQAGATSSSASYLTCQAQDIQAQVMGSISYVQETQQYLIVFNCLTPTDPGNALNSAPGVALFYATLDATQYSLADEDKWSAPREVERSWEAYDSSSGCNSYSLNYSSWMSPGTTSGTLSTGGGFIFSMQGCAGGGGTTSRQYVSRGFSIITSDDLVFRDGFDG